MSLGFSFETGGEVAYNKLDYALELFELEEGGEQDPNRPAARRCDGRARSAAKSTSTPGASCRQPVRARWRRSITNFAAQGPRRRHRRPLAQVPQAEPDARLAAGRRLAHPAVAPAHRRPARLLRFRQRRRASATTGSTAATPISCRSGPGKCRFAAEHPLLGDGKAQARPRPRPDQPCSRTGS